MCFYELPINYKVGTDDPLAPKEGAKPCAGKNNDQDWTKHVQEGVFTCRLQFKF
jgi:hypothetical protein